MNAWDLVTWFSACALAVSAVLIFAFFLRDARSILDREMHGHDDDAAENPSASGATPESPPPGRPEDPSR